MEPIPIENIVGAIAIVSTGIAVVISIISL